METDRDVRRNRVERVERECFAAPEARRDHHHRRGIDATTHHQIADGDVDRGRDAIVVGAQPDVTRGRFGRLGTPTVTRPPTARADRRPATPLAVLSVCSATK